MNTITVQVSAGSAILQDTKTIAVYGECSVLIDSLLPSCSSVVTRHHTAQPEVIPLLTSTQSTEDSS